MARKAKKGPIPMSEAEFVDRLLANIPRGTDLWAPRYAKVFLKTFKQTVKECVAEGYRVNFAGLVKFEPKFIPVKPKGEMVRNPRTGETAPRAAAVPAAFKVKATASSSLKAAFPSTRTNAGKELAERLG